MAVTTQILDHTPIPGHSFPSANKKRQFTRWVEAKENRQTPFTDYVPRTMPKPEQIEYETGQSYDPAITTTLGAQAQNNSATLTLATTTYIRAGDVLRITPYFTGTTDLDYSSVEHATVLSVTNSTDVVAKRHDGAVSSGSWATHASGSLVEVIARATNYNAAFPDGITWRGDIITNYIQRFDSGEITYDLFAARSSPTYESDNQMLEDIAKWRKRLLYYREQAFINGVKLAGDYTASPKVPYKLGGAIWWAQQKSDNRYAVGAAGAPAVLSIFDLSDAMEDKWINHMEGPGLDMWCGPRTRAALDSLLLPFKEGRLSETRITNRFDGVNTSFGDLTVKHAHGWPEGTILLCARNTYAWNNAEGMDWEKFERGPEILGAYQKSWNMSGDFGFTCNDVQRPILFEYVEVRKDRYVGRTLVGI